MAKLTKKQIINILKKCKGIKYGKNFSSKMKYNKLYSLMKDVMRDDLMYEGSLTDYRKVLRWINEVEWGYNGIYDYMNAVKNHEDVEARVNDDEGAKDLVNVLKGLDTYSTRKKQLVLRLYTDENDDKPRLTRVLSRDMMDSITNLIEELEGNAETPNTGFTFSDQDVMLSLLGVNKWSLKWEDRTIAEDVNGYFPYLNKSCLNLERYGIYKELKEENYSDNCLIHALKMSGLMSEEELNTLRSMMNTRYIKNKHLKYVAERFGLVIAVSRWNEEKKELMKPLRYGAKPQSGESVAHGKEVKLLARCNHYMIFDKTVDVEDLVNVKGKKMPLNRLINVLFDMGLMEEIKTDVCEYFIKYDIDEDEDLSYWSDEVREVKYNERERKNVKYVNDINEYVGLMKKQNTNKVSEYNGVMRSLKIDNGEIIKNFKTFCPFDVNMNEFFEDLRNEFGIDPIGYDSLSGYTFDAFKKCGCLDGVYEMTGKVAEFFRKCIKGGLIYAKRGVYENVVCVDINSSYGAAMMKMKGIPKGRPKIFYDKLPDRYDYFVAMVENEDKIEYVDMWEYRREKMKIIKGYYFDEGVNDKLHTFVNRLYELKKDNGKSLSKVAKFMIAQIYGKCIPKGSCEVVRIMNEENFKKFKINNSVFISRYEKVGMDKVKVWSKKEFTCTYIIPQLALQILSLSKIQLMNAINDRMTPGINDEEVYKIYTDSITMSKRLFDDLKFSEVINDKLGGWKIEYEATKLEIFNKQSYVAELINGERRIKGT